MSNLSDIFEEHKKNIVVLIDGVRKSAYEQGRADERNEILKELGNQLTQANCEKGIECVMARIRYVLGDEQKND